MIKHTLNYDNWLKINTPEIAYFFGYLWADGCLSGRSFSFEIIEKDFVNIWPILQKLGFNKYSSRTRTNSDNKQCSIHFGGKEFINLLYEYDFKNKSLNSPDKILSIIPNDLKHYFFRGYLDGDGSISITGKIRKTTRIAINSSIDYDWSFLEKLCHEIGINKYCIERKTRKNRTHKYSIFTLCSKEAILKFGNYIYQNYDKDKIGLERKNQKFNDIKDIYKIMQIFHSKRHENAINRFNNGTKGVIPNEKRIVDSKLLEKI